jgi:ABC-type Fe3+-hydroxamate transport system substrate-binding protein
MRIISLVPSVTETLFELGLGEKIVAVTRWCVRPPDQVKNKPKVGGTKNPKLNSIVDWRPDIVILDCDENRKEDAEELEKAGIKTYSIFPKSVEDSIDLIRNLGELFGVQEKTKAWIEEIKDRKESLRGAPRYSSLILIWRSPYITVNSDTYVDSASRMFGFDNVLGSHPERYPRITTEEIRNADPECVLFPDEPYPFRPKHVDAFKEQFPDIRAVKENRLLHFDGTYIAWHGYGTLRALREFPKQLA